MRGARWVGIALVAWVASACGHRGYPLLPRNVRESVHRDYPACRGRDIRGLDLGGGRYQVLACGMDVVYACATGPHSRWRGCAMEQTAGGYVATAQGVVATGPGAAPQAGTVIVVTGGMQGSQTIQAYPAQPVQAQPAPAPATTAQAQPQQAQPAVAAQAAVPTREQIEAGVGQWIDSHRAEILACTGTAAALVEVSWDASGAPVVALGGEMHGSPGEPCVARVLSGVQLNAGGQPGSVRHVVQ